MTMLAIARIRTDGGTQTRACIRPEIVKEYAELNGEMPPITVFYDGTAYWLADGFHRLEARKLNKKTDISTDIREGTLRQAVIFSFGANPNHGIRLSSEDKRYAVSKALNDTEWVTMSDRWIADFCHCSPTLVAEIRAQLQESCSPSATRTGKDGKERPATTKILCAKCKRLTHPVKDCPNCKTARDVSAEKKAEEKAKKDAEKAAKEAERDRKKKETEEAKAEKERKRAEAKAAKEKAVADKAAKKAAKKGKRGRAKPEPRAELKDALGQPLPDHLRDAFADTQLAGLIDDLENAADLMHPEQQLARACKLCDHYGFILADKFKQHVYDALHSQQLAIEALKAGLPHAICPKCKAVDSKKDGKVCRGCRGFGFVPDWRYAELTKG